MRPVTGNSSLLHVAFRIYLALFITLEILFLWNYGFAFTILFHLLFWFQFSAVAFFFTWILYQKYGNYSGLLKLFMLGNDVAHEEESSDDSWEEEIKLNQQKTSKTTADHETADIDFSDNQQQLSSIEELKQYQFPILSKNRILQRNVHFSQQ